MFWSATPTAMAAWHHGKLAIEQWTALDHDLLHALVGAAVWLALVRLTRRPIMSWLPWLGLFAIILWNEAVDLRVEQWPDPLQQYGEGAKDLAVTMLAPTLLLLGARLWHFRRRRVPSSRT